MKALKKSSGREIRKSLGRYLAILAIVALGVGFFCGLRVCRDAMVKTGEDYLDRQSLYDYRLISTVGFSRADEASFAALEGVVAAEGSVTQDALVESDSGDLSGVVRFHALTERVNAVSLTAGRLPQSKNELVVDAKRFGIDSIGTTLRITDLNDEDALSMFALREYTIVGIGNSPTYMNYERGSTSLGNGTVLAFAYLPPDGFDCDYFTEIYIRLDAEGAIYSDEYQSDVERYEGDVTDSGEARARARFESLIGDAERELTDGQSEYDRAYAQYLEKRAEAERELQKALDDLVAGGGEIAANEQKLIDGEEELSDARAQYGDGKDALADSLRRLESAEEDAYARLDAAQTRLDGQLAAVREGIEQIEQSGVVTRREELVQGMAQIEDSIARAGAAREQLLGAGDTLRAGIARAQEGIDLLAGQKQEALGDFSARREALTKEIEALEGELAGLAPGDDDRIAELNAELEDLRAQKDELARQIASTQTEYDEKISAAQEERDALSIRAGEAADAVAALEAERDKTTGALEDALSQAEADLTEKEAELGGLDPADAGRIEALGGEISALRDRISSLAGEISAVKGDYAERIDAAGETSGDLAAQLARADGDLARLKTERERALKALTDQLAAAEDETAGLEGELAGLTPSPDATRRAEINAQLTQKRAGLRALEEQSEAVEADFERKIEDAQEDKAALERQLSEHEASYEQNLARLNGALEELEKQRAQTQEGLDALEQYDQLCLAVPQLEDGLAQTAQRRFQADEQFAAARRELRAGRSELAEALVQIQDAERELSTAREQLETAREELEDGRAEYTDARREADREFFDAERELSEARAEIADAREKISEIEEPDVYVLDRTANIGYVCFESDSQIVQGISNVFPLFFFMVAALVCMTTMTRMVDEQRTQIGVLKAIGYGSGAIMGKFVFYSGSAAFLGGVIGFFAGSALFPRVIWMAYDIMYGFSDLQLVFDWGLGAASLAAALLCSVGATYFSVRRELALTPAALLRPAAPKAGRRILLERVRPIWRRLSFMRKLTVRNIFRHKKRLVMMVIGIGGCTALLVTGLGIRDSISNVVNYQYDEITLYDIAVTFTREQDGNARRAFAEAAGGEMEDCLFVHEGTADVSASGATKSVYLVVTDEADVSAFVDLHLDAERVALPGEGEAVISLGLAEALGVTAGDEIAVRDGDMRQMNLRVCGIFENYIYNYVFVRLDTCASLWGYAPEVKSAYVNAREGGDARELAARLASLEGAAGVSVNLDMRERVNGMMENLDYIVMMVVFSAGALAFIVLYNLTNINITERAREIATVKVLGFFPRETAAYVFSENLLLCLVSALAGLPLGKLLHAFVIAQIKIDMIRFDVRVAPLSYILAIALTFAFALLVNFALRFKLEKINMAESLKTVE